MSSLMMVSTRLDAAFCGLLEHGASLAEERGLNTVAVCISTELPSDAAETVGIHGVQQLIHIELDPEALNAEKAVVDALCEQIQNCSEEAVLFLNSVFLSSVAPMVAASLGCGITADCTKLEWSATGKLLQTRPTFGGRKLAVIENVDIPAMATVRRGVYVSERGSSAGYAEKQVLRFMQTKDWELCQTLAALGVEELSDARVILAGGAGVGSKENFQKLHRIAKALGASVGASRAAVAAGFAPYQYQIGQTGISVRPEVYVAFGISGAVQHLSGISGAKKIIAINNDPNAPIHEYSMFSLVADCVEVLDTLCAELQC